MPLIDQRIRQAAQDGDATLLRELLPQGDPNATDVEDWNALMHAIWGVSFECVDLLLPLTDLSRVNSFHDTALAHAQDIVDELDDSDSPESQRACRRILERVAAEPARRESEALRAALASAQDRPGPGPKRV